MRDLYISFMAHTRIERVLITIVTAFIGLILFYFVDSSFLDTEPTQAYTVAEKYHAPYTSTTVTMVGDMPVTNVTHHPERFEIQVDAFGTRVYCPASRQQYDNFKLEEQVVAQLAIGRITGNTYCKSFRGVK